MKKKERMSRSYVVGIISLVFLIIGYQTALFVHKAAVAKIVSNRDHPDTVYVVNEDIVVRKETEHSPEAMKVASARREVKTFRFNPNTVSVEDLQLLGFTQKQAQSIDNYRKKGGRFRRKSDFAKSFVVSDEIYRRLEPFIDIPLLDLNLADSAAFDALPGIGGYFAAKMVSYRAALGGTYSYKEQLMDIYNFSEEKFGALKDLITVDHEMCIHILCGLYRKIP